MKEIYVFLDIDGVMNNLDWAVDMMLKVEYQKIICPINVDALNYLLQQLKSKYKPIIVVTSLRRINKQYVKRKLNEAGVDYQDEYGFTPFWQASLRGQKIKNYIRNNNIENYVVIDNMQAGIKDYIPSDKIIKTSLKSGGLTKTLVDNYIKKSEYQNCN